MIKMDNDNSSETSIKMDNETSSDTPRRKAMALDDVDAGALTLAIFVFLLCGGISVPSLVIGQTYWEDCNLNAAQYLFYGGLLGTCFCIFYIFCILAEYTTFIRSSEDGVWRRRIAMIFVVAMLIRVFCGMVLIYPEYSTWDPKEAMMANTTIDASIQNGNYTGGIGPEVSVISDQQPSHEMMNLNYCHYVPFTFAFVSLIIETVFLSSIVIYVVWCPVYLCCCMACICCCNFKEYYDRRPWWLE